MQVEILEEKISNFLKTEVFDGSVEFKNCDPLRSVGVQSIELMELVFFIEREFDCKLPQEFLLEENCSSIRAVASFVAHWLFDIPNNQKELAFEGLNHQQQGRD